jgi:hypothetical protein
VTPTDGAITLEWSGSDADGDALSYTIEMDTTDGLQGTIVAESTTETQATVNVETNTIYYWRIITSDGVNSATSIVYSFCFSCTALKYVVILHPRKRGPIAQLVRAPDS